jgi:hypothetical protein
MATNPEGFSTGTDGGHPASPPAQTTMYDSQQTADQVCREQKSQTEAPMRGGSSPGGSKSSY